MPTLWFNGRLVEEDDARISVRDLGLLHGAGVFTTMRADASVVFGLDAHLKRLRHSCETFSIPLGYDDDSIREAIAELLADNTLTDARLRMTVTRGEQTLDPVHGMTVRPNTFIAATALEAYPPELYETGMTVLAYDDSRLNPYDPQAGHKTLDYLSRLAALREAQRRGANEALLFSVHNFLQSTAIANVFLVKDGTLMTPPTNDELRDEATREKAGYPRSNVLPGITRAAVLSAADREGIPVELRGLTINDVLAADEIFLTNSIMRVMPVCHVERRDVGNAKPGAITRLLANAAFVEVAR